MPTPPKPYAVLCAEGRSHRTRAELEQRRKGEAALLTGEPMKEWAGTRESPGAHKHFLRVRKLLKAIGKDDALNEAVINRYCVLLAETGDLERDRQKLARTQERNEEWVRLGEMDEEQYEEAESVLIGRKLALEKTLGTKRKMLLDLEKENIMTIAAGLRSIPKKQDEDEGDDKMSGMLDRRMRVV